jgi:hypothetical protein
MCRMLVPIVSVIDVASRREMMQIPVGKIPKRIVSVELPRRGQPILIGGSVSLMLDKVRRRSKRNFRPN